MSLMAGSGLLDWTAGSTSPDIIPCPCICRNGLWAFAYALLITGIWSGSESWLKYFWMASIPVLVFGYEILQYFGTIPGTFCIQDLALGFGGLILGIIAGIKIPKSNNHENAFE
jgi:hypothetical protein